MAASSKVTTHSRLPAARPFVSPPLSLQFHRKQALHPTTTNGNALFSNFINKRITSMEPRNNIVNATTDQISEERQIQPQTKSMSILDWMFSFSRPFVMLSSVIGLSGTLARACMENSSLIQPSNLIQFSCTTFAVLFAKILTDGFINQMNNIVDVDIDRINKPHLALASGAISMNTARAMVATAAVSSVGIAIFLKSQAFLLFIMSQLLVGVVYSVPPIYAKRRTYGALFCMATMRGYSDCLLLCSGASTILGVPFQLSPPVLFLVIFTSVFGLAIGVMKDLPDIKGDMMQKVPTLAAKYGLRPAAYIGFGLIFISYIGAIAAGFLYPHMFKQNVMVLAHLAIIPYVAFQALKLNQENYNKNASRRFYLMMWNLLNLEFSIFPFI